MQTLNLQLSFQRQKVGCFSIKHYNSSIQFFITRRRSHKLYERAIRHKDLRLSVTKKTEWLCCVKWRINEARFHRRHLWMVSGWYLGCSEQGQPRISFLWSVCSRFLLVLPGLLIGLGKHGSSKTIPISVTACSFERIRPRVPPPLFRGLAVVLEIAPYLCIAIASGHSSYEKKIEMKKSITEPTFYL